MIEIHNLTICHRYDLRKIIDNLTLTVKPTDKIAIIGEEGNGKSTLLKCIKDSQLIESYCEVHGEIRSKNERIGYLPQELEQKHVEKTVYEYFCESDAFLLATPSQLHDIAQALGNDVEMYYQTQIMSTLSGGEKIKYQLAAILLEQPSILLLDEPSNDLDISTLAWLENFIKESKIPIIYISHDETLLANTANCIVHLELVKRKTEARHTIMHIGYMPQNYDEILDEYESPIDFLTTVGDKEDITRIRQYLGSMKFTSDEMEHSLTELSGGQRAKVFMLKMHLEGANVLLLDEPTRNFSPLSAPVVREELKNFGGAIIAVSHDRKFIQEVFDDIYLFNSTGLHRYTIESE